MPVHDPTTIRGAATLSFRPRPRKDRKDYREAGWIPIPDLDRRELAAARLDKSSTMRPPAVTW